MANFIKMSAKDLEEQIATASAAVANDPNDRRIRPSLYMSQYNYSKYIRKDNTPEYAKYLGYLNTGELYPDFKFKTFREFAVELLNGKTTRPYPRSRFA